MSNRYAILKFDFERVGGIFFNNFNNFQKVGVIYALYELFGTNTF